MVDPANPPDSSLQTEPESRVHERSVFPEVEIPAVGLHWQPFLADSGQQLVVIVFALRSTNDLPVALWGQTIIAKHGAGIGGILLHVKRLCFLWIVGDEDRAVVPFVEKCFIFRAEILAPLHRAALSLKDLYGFAVVDTRERRFDGLQLG